MSTTMGATFGGCTALLVTLVYTKVTTGKAMWDLIMSTNGALTGMVVCLHDHSLFCPVVSANGTLVFIWSTVEHGVHDAALTALLAGVLLTMVCTMQL